MSGGKKKKELTEQQIIQYILSGGSPKDLEDAGVDMTKILVSIAANPNVLSSAREQANTYGSALESYNPDETYYDPQEVKLDPSYRNDIKDKWLQASKTNPEAAGLAAAYFQSVEDTGNDPSQHLKIRTDLERIAVDGMGMPLDQFNVLADALESERDIYYRTENDVKRKIAAKNYAEFQSSRNKLDLESGETAQQGIFRKLTGLPELYDLPDTKTTFAELARKGAVEAVPEAKVVPARGTLGRGSKGGAATLAKRAIAEKQVTADRSRYESAYMRAVEKAGKSKSTPYNEAVKKLIPQILAKRKLGL